MNKLVVSLVLATVGFAPAFANEAPSAKVEPNKSEEIAAKAEAPKVKESGATVLLATCGQCTTDNADKKDAQAPATPETTKPVPATKSV